MFEYDKTKSELNLSKHGIDFEEAKALWFDLNGIIFPAAVSDEKRFLLVAKLYKKHWTAIYTTRNGNIRIISVRRSRKNEVQAYEG